MALDLFIPPVSAQPIGSYQQFSPLVLADRMITLAQEADREGYAETASGLLGLMFSLLDQGAPTRS